MKKLVIILISLITVSGSAICQLTLLGGGLNLGTGFRYGNETYDRDLYKSPLAGFYLKGVIKTRSALRISPSFSFFIPRTNRIPDVGTSFKSTSVNEFAFNADGNYPVFSPGWIELYGLAGINITYATIKWNDGTFSPSSDNGLGFNMGAGLNFRFTDRIILNGEAKFIAGKYHQIMYTAGALINVEKKKIVLK